MSEEGNQPKNPGEGQTKELNLQKMAEQFMVGVQRHLDMLAFNLASREAATEEAYVAHAQATKVMPAPPIHRNFEQMQAYSRDLLACQVVNDSLNLAANCLHNVHFFLALVKANKAFGNLSQESQQEAQKKHQEFLKAPLDQKFNRLEEEYGVMCELEDAITSLGFAMQALVKHGGIVKKAHLGDQDVLEIELKVAKADAEAGAMWRQPSPLESSSTAYHEGDKIVFSDSNLQSVLLTVAAFGHQLFTAVSNYARENQSGQ